MGQYYIFVNMDKKEFIHPHCFGDGLKALEFGSGGTILKGLACLLTKSDGGGGGDWSEEQTNTVGRWAGDRIWIVGDYDTSELYDTAQKEYTDISEQVIRVLEKEGLMDNPQPFLKPDMIISIPRR